MSERAETVRALAMLAAVIAALLAGVLIGDARNPAEPAQIPAGYQLPTR
jgi:hypothetical protein